MKLPIHALVPFALAATLAAAAAVPSRQPAQPGGSRADSQRLVEKAARVAANGERRAPAALRTTVTERELNAYLAYDGAEALPPGVTKPTLVLHGDRRVAGTAVVDLDAVRAERKPTGMLDPMGYLAGKLPVAASGWLEARDGVARFQLEAASVAGIPIPRMVLQEVVAFYTRSPEYPKGVSLDDPFPLPAAIKAIEVRRGEAVVVQ
ncbi:MAG TPA: hypothetical protein VK911_13390 [Vicinamibacterales bacterium]|nr:hypothetical protein [Vicinamibacterales bacterium]